MRNEGESHDAGTLEGDHASSPARNIAKEILDECEGTIISLEAVLALRLAPDSIPKQQQRKDYDRDDTVCLAVA